MVDAVLHLLVAKKADITGTMQRQLVNDLDDILQP